MDIIGKIIRTCRIISDTAGPLSEAFRSLRRQPDRKSTEDTGKRVT